MSDSLVESGGTSNETLWFSGAELTAGAVAGFAEHFVMFPFDTIKTRMQSGSGSNVREAVRHMWQSERPTHLYRGCAPVLFSAVPAHAVYFGIYEATKRVFGDNTNLGIALSACCATVAHDTVSTPFDVIKQRMQMDKNRTYSSSFKCAVDIVKTESSRALFLSLPTTIAMNIPHFATYWLVYEGAIAYMNGGKPRDPQLEDTAKYMLAGFLAGGMASVVSFPFDMAKTQMQLGRGKDFFTILKNIISTGGTKALFAGVLPRVLYTAPSGAIMMTTYETTKHFLSSK